MKAPDVQWWLATLDQYGNPTLCDGAHTDRAGVERAIEIYEKLTSGNNFLHRKIGTPNPHGYAIARVELFPVSSTGEGQ